MKNNILHSSDYNLFMVCPNILKYKSRYTDYINHTYTFKFDNFDSKTYFDIKDAELKISSFSSYLVYSILMNFFINQVVIKKDIESYYNAEILTFLKKLKLISQFEIKSLALAWNSISKTIDLYSKYIKNHTSIQSNYEVYWSNLTNNFKENIPLIGINQDSSIDIYLILQIDFKKFPLQSHSIDYLKIPSVVRILYIFYNQQININKLKILWLDNTNLQEKFKFSIYENIFNEKNLEYIKNKSDILNFKLNSSLRHSDLFPCFSCLYFNQCISKNIILDESKHIEL